MCLVCDIPPTLGRSREASLGWGGPEEWGGDAPLILPGIGVAKAIPVFAAPAAGFARRRPGDPGLHLGRTTAPPPGAG